MAEAPTLNNLANLTNETTAVATINGNSSAIATAFEDVLSLSGTAPNQMQSPLDMNSNAIVNLPAPISGSSPLRLTDAAILNGGGTITTGLPVGGTAGEVLTKNSSTNYDVSWLTQRTILTGNITYHVSTTGSDSNPGTSSLPFLTPQKAWNVIAQTLDLAGFTVTVQMADGTYSSAGFILLAGEGPPGVYDAASIVFQGNASDNTKVVFAGTAGAVNVGVSGRGAAQLSLQNLTLQSTSGHGLQVSGAFIVFNNLNFGACPGAFACHIYGDHDAFVTIGGGDSYTISGGAYSHATAQTGACLALHASTVTYLNSPVFSGANIVAQYAGLVFYGSITFVNAGTVTGINYTATQNGYIDVAGLGTSYIPGSIAGFCLSGGQFDSVASVQIGNIASIGTGVGTFLTTPSSANLAAAITDETGSGALVFATSPTLTTPVLGAATGTSVSLTGKATVLNATATTAGGSTTPAIAMGTVGLGVYFGSGLPTITAPQGSLYCRTDGSSSSTRLYINTTGSTTWTNVTTAA